jgi:hypothetical protein
MRNYQVIIMIFTIILLNNNSILAQGQVHEASALESATNSLSPSSQNLETKPHFDEVTMIRQLYEIGRFFYKEAKTTVSARGTTVHHPAQAYLLICRDAMEVAPGKEHLKIQGFLWQGLSWFACGAACAHFVCVGTFINMLSSGQVISPRKVIYNLVFLGAEMLAAAGGLYLSIQCEKQWQVAPKCLEIEPCKVIKEEFWHLYPQGSKLQYRIEPSRNQTNAYLISILTGMVLGGLGYGKMCLS